MESDSLITRIVKSSRLMRTTYDEFISRAAEECDLTRPEADVLLFLYNNPTLNTAHDAALYRGFSKAYVSRAVEPLVKRGMISVTPDPADRRRQLLSITGGAAAAQRLHAAQRSFLALLMQGIPRSDIDRFIEISESMCRNIAEYSARNATDA